VVRTVTVDAAAETGIHKLALSADGTKIYLTDAADNVLRSMSLSSNGPVAGTPTVGTPDPVTGTVTGVLNFTDPDNNTLAFTVPTQPASGTVTVAANGTYTYTPTQAARDAATTAQGAKTATFTVVASDGLTTTSVNVTVPILPTNRPPVAGTPTVGTPNPTNGTVSGALNFTDPDGNTLTYTVPTQPASGTVTVSASGTYTYTPTQAARDAAATAQGAKTATFTVVAGDGQATTSVSVTVDILPSPAANRPPVAGTPTVGTPNATTGAVSGALNFTDPDGNTLTYTVPTQPASGTVTVSASGTYTYTPTQAARDAAATPQGAKSATFTVVASDGLTTASVNVTVPILATQTGTNSPPVITGTTAGTPDPVTGKITGAVTATDPNGNPLTYSLSGAQPASGTVSVNANGTFTFTPTTAARLAAGTTAGPDYALFTVAVSDGQATTTTTVSVAVLPAVWSNQVLSPTTDSVPYGVVVVGDKAYVANQGTNTVSVIDIDDGSLVSTITVGSAPTNLVSSPSRSLVYVTNRSSNTVSVISTTTNQVVGSPITVGTQPESITINADGTRVYVANFASNNVSVIDTDPASANFNKVIATIAVGTNPRGIAFAQTVNGPRVYVVNRTAGSVSVINASTNQLSGSAIAVGSIPQQIVVSADGTRAYVSNYGSNTVSVINTATNAVDGAPIAVPSMPVGVALSADGSVLYVANGNDKISVVDTRTRAVVTTLTIDTAPESNFHMIAVAPDGSLVITDTADKALRVVDLLRGQTLTVTQSQPDPSTGVITGTVSTDVPGSVTYAPTTPSLGSVVFNSNGTFTYTPTTVARQMARITTAPITDQFSVTVADGSGSTQTTTVTVNITPVDVTGVDVTAALQAVFDRLKPGDTLTLQPGTYRYSSILRINTSGVTINGAGATMYSTNAMLSSLQILASNVSLSNLNLSSPTGLIRDGSTNSARLLFGGDGVKVTDVTIVGGAGAGVYVVGATNFEITRVSVSDTAADGIQMTGGSNHGTVNDVTVARTGDDSIAVVSYKSDAAPVTDIVINNPTVVNNLQARGIAIVGGERITINNFTVTGSSQGGLFIGSQGSSFNTRSTKDITVNGGTITGSNTAYFFQFGAITILSQNPGESVSNVTISNVTIKNPYPGQAFNIAVATAGNASTWQEALTAQPQGTMSNITFENIAIIESPELPVFYSNAPGTYTATGFTMNGRPIVINTSTV
jgi:YVTN family beta-propeller protein/VCBS repeat-containing protein